MGFVKITYAQQAYGSYYCALYIDDEKVLDCETYEADPLTVIQALVAANLLDNVILDDIQVYFKDQVEFPHKLSDLTQEQLEEPES